jgi:hypothetical protein
LHPDYIIGTNIQNVFLYFDFNGNLIFAKTFGYKNFYTVIGHSINFDSYGDYLFDTSFYKKTSTSKSMFLIRKS